FVLSESVIRGNNSESFKQAPVSGGVKITTSQNVLISANVFEQNLTDGLWFDAEVSDVRVLGNKFVDNGGNGLELEMSSGVLVANNYFIRNVKSGIYIIDSNTISVWNNTFHDNKSYSVRLFQDTRRSSDPVFSMLVRDVSLKNNVLSYGAGSCQYLVDDYEKKISGQTMRVKSEGNAYHRAGPSSPANLVCWANGAKLASYKNLADFRSGTGNDLRSSLSEGASILTSSFQLTPAALANSSSVALPIPAAVASAIGVPADTRRLGAVTPILK
ncbi:right-handed parallel beta-helix repeat-containing protein, partial [Tessaracoccus antarcticus]